jgi:hypothetical protein
MSKPFHDQNHPHPQEPISASQTSNIQANPTNQNFDFLKLAVTPGSAPLKSQLDILEANPKFQQEMLREIKSVANQRLASLDLVFQSLQNEANRVLGAAQRDLFLHSVLLNGTKIRGQSYYLYVKENQNRFFSLLNPQEYQQISTESSCVGYYRLNYDGSWTRLDGDDTEDQLKYAPKKD